MLILGFLDYFTTNVSTISNFFYDYLLPFTRHQPLIVCIQLGSDTKKHQFFGHASFTLFHNSYKDPLTPLSTLNVTV